MNNLKELRNSTQCFKVLYVEDDQEIQTTMYKYLNKLFKSVDIADDGLYGLELYKQNTYDIVITDLSMPKMDGICMIKKILEINPNQNILVTTAHNESNFKKEAQKLSVNGYIVKPFDFKQLNAELFKITNSMQACE